MLSLASEKTKQVIKFLDENLKKKEALDEFFSRICLITIFLVERNIAFHGGNCRFSKDSNDTFMVEVVPVGPTRPLLAAYSALACGPMAADRWGTILDDKLRPDSSVQTYAGILRVHFKNAIICKSSRRNVIF